MKVTTEWNRSLRFGSRQSRAVVLALAVGTLFSCQIQPVQRDDAQTGLNGVSEGGRGGKAEPDGASGGEESQGPASAGDGGNENQIEESPTELPNDTDESDRGDPSTPKRVLTFPCDVEEVLKTYCWKCHAVDDEDGVRPRLATWEEVRAAAGKIRGALIGTGPIEMPPLGRISDEGREILLAWIKANAEPREVIDGEPSCVEEVE